MELGCAGLCVAFGAGLRGCVDGGGVDPASGSGDRFDRSRLQGPAVVTPIGKPRAAAGAFLAGNRHGHSRGSRPLLPSPNPFDTASSRTLRP